MPTALEIAQGRNIPLTTGLFMAIQTKTPLLSMFDVRTTADADFLSLDVIELPKSAFTDLNEGFESSTGTLGMRKFACKLLGGIVATDVIATGIWDKAHPTADSGYFDMQVELKFLADAMNVERQMILGVANDAKGFPGARQLSPFTPANVFTMLQNGASDDFKRSVLNVGGTTNGEASCVYSFVHGDMDSQLILGGDAGGDGEIVTLREIPDQMWTPDPVNAPLKSSLHHLAQLDGRLGFAVSGMNEASDGENFPTQGSVRRATNVTTEGGKTLTDKVMVKLSRSHGTGKRPDLYAMSERSGEQLAESRAPVTVNFNMGAGDAATHQANQYPDPPEHWRDTKIAYPLPSVIGDTDAIEVAA